MVSNSRPKKPDIAVCCYEISYRNDSRKFRTPNRKFSTMEIVAVSDFFFIALENGMYKLYDLHGFEKSEFPAQCGGYSEALLFFRNTFFLKK